jgi:hypothetical protein
VFFDVLVLSLSFTDNDNAFCPFETLYQNADNLRS